MAKKLLKYIYYLTVLIAVGILMAFVNNKNESRNITDLKINILDIDSVGFVDEDMVKNKILKSYDSLFYRSKKNIDLVAVENSIENLDQVKSAELFMSVDGDLLVNVTQLKPIARVYSGKKSFYLDERGKKMELSKKYTKAVPLVMGNVDKENYEELFKLISYIRSNKVLNEQVVSIEIDKHNDYFLRTRKGNQIIELGKPVDIEEKFEKLMIFYRRTVSEYGWKRYKRINLEFTNQVVCTKR